MKDLLRNPDAWVDDSVVTGAEFAALDKGNNESLDGAGGGAYAPTAALTIGGKGIQDAYSETVAVVGNSSGQATVSNIQAHRLRITGGATVTDRLTIQFAADAEGTCREVTIDSLQVACDVYARDENNAVIASGSFFNRDTVNYVTLKFERLGGVWVCSNRPDTGSAGNAQLISPNNTDAVSLGGYADTLCTAGGGAAMTGGFLFNLPRGENGTKRRVHFDYIKSSGLLFKYGNLTITDALIGPGGERNLVYEFIYASGWKLQGISRTPYTRGQQTLTVVALPADNVPIAVDTNNYSVVAIDAPLTYERASLSFTVKEPAFEHQELRILFSHFTGQNYLPIVYVSPEGGFVFSTVMFSDQVFAYHEQGSDLLWGGGRPATLVVRVVGGVWRHESFSF